MAVSASFHRNVLLLTQLILPNDEFKKHFREGMFDKPNTAGFIHVSHYLLTIYDSDRFKKQVQWPVTCKKTEAKYRNDVKNYLTVIAAENPDIGFPAILASHLFHAGGSKFTTIMLKLSQVVVRTYMKQETNYNVMSAPKSGVAGHLAKRHLEETNARLHSNILSCHKKVLAMEETAKTALQSECETLSKIKGEIFEKEKSIANHASNAPVHSSIKKRLVDTSDAEVVQMWKKSLKDSLNYIQKQHLYLKELESLSNSISNIVIGNNSDAQVLDGKQYKRIDLSAISESPFPPNVQCLLYHLYKDDKLILHTFFVLFSSLLTHIYQWLKVNALDDFSECLVQVEASCEDMKSVFNYFETFLTEVAKISAEVQNTLCEKNIPLTYNDNILPVMNNVLLMPSPHIKIDTNCDNENNDFQKQLQLTPVEVAHKSLFSRYERRNQNRSMHGPKLRGNLFISRINIDDSISISSSEKQSSRTCFMVPKSNLSTIKQTGKYSRLFSSHMKKNNTMNASIMSLPCSSKANSTAITNAIEEVRDISELDLDMTVKSICSIREEFATPEKCTRTKESESDTTSKEDKNIANTPSPPKPSILKIDELTEVEITNNYDLGIVKTEQSKQVNQRRRSIGDLVERYKRLLELNNHTSSPKISHTEHENE